MVDPVKLANFRTKAEAEAAAQILKRNGIPCLIQSAEGMLHGPLFPGATLYVAPEAVEEAVELLDLDTEEQDVGFDAPVNFLTPDAEDDSEDS